MIIVILHSGPPRGGGGAKGAICPGPPAKGAPHKKRMKYAVKINSNTLRVHDFAISRTSDFEIFPGENAPGPL